MVAILDTIDLGDGVVVSAPPLLELIAGTDVHAGVFDAVRTEMLARGMVNGPDWSPRLVTGPDTLHLTDAAMLRIADAFLAALP